MIQVGFADSPARTAPPANGCFGANWPAPLIGCSWPQLLPFVVAAESSGQAAIDEGTGEELR
jgi:hypothetical protein